jgi:hypothetical protein
MITERELMAMLNWLEESAFIFVRLRGGGLAPIQSAEVCDVVDEDHPLPFGTLVTDIDAPGY